MHLYFMRGHAGIVFGYFGKEPNRDYMRLPQRQVGPPAGARQRRETEGWAQALLRVACTGPRVLELGVFAGVYTAVPGFP